MSENIVKMYDKLGDIREEILNLESFGELTYDQRQRVLTILLCDMQHEERRCER